MRLIALFHKDLLLLLRDPWGLVLLFLMPWALVILMASLQDSTFRTLEEQHIPLVLLNEDADSLGNTVSRELAASRLFDITTTVPNDQPLTAEAVEKAVARGDYLIGVVIPKQTTEHLRQRVTRGVARAFGSEEDTVAPDTAPLEIRLLIDPTAKPSFRASVVRAVRENMLTIQHRMLLREISDQVSRIVPLSIDLSAETEGGIVLTESYARAGRSDLIPNATQHNVPAWSMFAVFFIVISLAGNMIRERETGCFARLLTMPCPYALYLTGKVLVHLLVCLLQLALLLLTGLYLMPHLGLPPLRLGHDYAALALMCLAVSLSAVGYGLAIGSVARTAQQASIFGAVSVVILAAIGGVWIPTFVMPPLMRTVARLSPLNWGLEGFNTLFVRGGSLSDIAPYAAASLGFFAAMLGVAVIKRKTKN